MSNLTEISIATRKFTFWSIIVFITYIILKIIIGLGIQMWKAAHPTPVPPPNMRFDKLPVPKFSGIATSSSGLKFSLENVEGKPPETTAAGKVYQMPKKLPTLLAADKAKKLAMKLNFPDPPEIVTSTYYRFTDPIDKLHTLEIDITTMNFKLKYDYVKNPEIFNHGNSFTKEQAVSEANNTIQPNNLFDESILKGIITTDILKYNSTNLTFTTAVSLSDTNVIRVNYFRKDLDDMKILPVGFDKSYNYALYTAANTPYPRLAEINYSFWPISFDDFATYPLKSSVSAWQDLIDGYAYVAKMGNNLESNNIVIRKIYLSYYDSEDPQLYLQPIFVFEGDNNFVAYAPAILPEWLE